MGSGELEGSQPCSDELSCGPGRWGHRTRSTAAASLTPASPLSTETPCFEMWKNMTQKRRNIEESQAAGHGSIGNLGPTVDLT